MTSDATGSGRPGPGPVGASGPRRAAALDALLRDLDALRTTVQIDLSLAAGAAEAGASDLAVHLLRADRDELAGFRRRALAHLQLPRGRCLSPPGA